MPGLPSSIAGFIIIPISYSSTVTHVVYARSHEQSKNPNRKMFPVGRTLFLVNVPPDATEREFVIFFKYAGTVERVVFAEQGAGAHDESSSDDEPMQADNDIEEKSSEDERPKKRPKKTKVAAAAAPEIVPLPDTPLRTLRRTGASAHVVFLDESSVARALASPKPRPWPTPSEPSGLARYIALHDALRPPLDVVREHADSYIEHYEHELAKTRQKSKYRKGEAIVDEDGFTLVTRGGVYGQTLGGGVAVASKKFQQTGETSTNKRKKKMEPKEKETFYAFQKTEKQRKAVLDLKKKWEDDQKKVQNMKASRRFKPY